MITLVGQTTPGFSAMSSEGYPVSPGDLKGKWVILYFYPEDDTSGCTKEACGFRDSQKEFEKRDAKVFGVSPDDIDSHHKFIKKHGLNFPLLADPDHEVAEAFEVWNGKGVARTTFVIDPEGKIAKVFENVKPEGHFQEVLGYLDTVMVDWAM